MFISIVVVRIRAAVQHGSMVNLGGSTAIDNCFHLYNIAKNMPNAFLRVRGCIKSDILSTSAACRPVQKTCLEFSRMLLHGIVSTVQADIITVCEVDYDADRIARIACIKVKIRCKPALHAWENRYYAHFAL